MCHFEGRIQEKGLFRKIVKSFPHHHLSAASFKTILQGFAWLRMVEHPRYLQKYIRMSTCAQACGALGNRVAAGLSGAP
jgi:hypothetical protein